MRDPSQPSTSDGADLPSDGGDGPRVLLVHGFWGQNIGNAFFNLGGAHLLRAALGDDAVALVQDQPAYWTFRDESKGNYVGSFPLMTSIKSDLVVLQGPVFTRNFGPIWADSLRRLAERSTEWAGLGIGLRSYSSEEQRVVAEVLRSYPPRFISTRDRSTYDFLSGLGLDKTALHDGVDSAFFCPKAYRPPEVDVAHPLLALCFDHYPEPSLLPMDEGPIQLGDQRYEADQQGWRVKAADFGKATGIIAQVMQRKRPAEIGGHTVVRPAHRTNPHLPWTIYRPGSALASDEPYSYLALYSSAALTLSDRVHACVAALAYGRQAMLLNPATKRSALFDRVGCGDIRTRPYELPSDLVDEEFEKQLSFISRSC